LPSSINPFLWSTIPAGNDIGDPGINWAEGQTPGSVNGSARALMAAIARLIADNNGTKAMAGAANAYTLAVANLDHAALTNGITLAVKASFTNSGAATLNLNSLGAKKIRKLANAGGVAIESELSAGDIGTNGHYALQYDAAADGGNGAFILLNPSLDANAGMVGEIRIWSTASAPTGWLVCGGQAVSRTIYAALFALIGTTYGVGDGATTFNVPDLRGRAPVGRDDMGGAAAGRVTAAGSGIAGTILGAAGGSETHALTIAQLPAHAHSGTTGTESASHAHAGAGTTTSESAPHSHAVNDPGHAHTPSYTNVLGFFGFGSAGATGGPSNTTSINLTIGSNTTGISLGPQDAAHTHNYAFTTGPESATHTHAFTTATAGSGAAHQNLPPSLIVNYIIRT